MKTKSIIVACYFFMSAMSVQNIVSRISDNTGAWVDLGTATVTRAADHDGVVIKGEAQNFRKLKITVRNMPIAISRIEITYDQGDVQHLDIPVTIAKNGESEMIDIEGSERSIKRIDFWYNAQDFARGKAIVNFFVRK